MSITVEDNPGENRYELHEGSELAAFTEYRPNASVMAFVHTETLPGFEGRGLAGKLVGSTLDDVRRRGWRIRPECEFVRGYIARNPEYMDLVPESVRTELFPS